MKKKNSKNNEDANIKDYLDNIVERIPYFIFWKNIASIYVGCNQKFANLVNKKSPQEVIGKTDFTLDWGKGESELFRHGDLEVINGNPKVNEEEVLIRPDGSQIIMLVNKLPMLNKLGECIGILGTSVDITKQKQAHIAKQEFLQNMAHDIRTPLAGIIGLSHLQTMGLKSLEESKQYGQMIHGAGNELLDLLNAVIRVIDTEQMTEPVKMDPLDLSRLAKELQTLIGPSIYTKKLRFTLDIDQSLPTILSDRIKLKRILINLLSNAVKFTQKGEISLAVKLLNIENNYANLEIRVTDTGIGIAKENLDKIFNRFYRVHPSYVAEYKGYGIGLYLAKEILVLLGGEINVFSEEGKGTCFILHFTFPVADKLADKIEPVLPYISDNPSNKAGPVLIAEDNALVLHVIKNLLEKAGYAVIATADGKAALKALQNNCVAWALLDIGLPEISGTETCKQYRHWEKENNKPSLPIFALTSHSVDEVGKECSAVGIDQVFTKPLTNKIIHEIEAVLCSLIKQ